MRLSKVLPVMVASLFSLSTASFAAFQTFDNVGTIDGSPVNATAEFTPGAGTLMITLINNVVNPTSRQSAISDVFFKVSGTTSIVGDPDILPSTTYINIAGDGTFSNAGAQVFTWELTQNGSYHLNKLYGGSGPPGAANQGLIIGEPGAGGEYSNANGSIAGNQSNPFARHSATFQLTLNGVTADSIISDVLVSFGTNGAVIPIPAAVWLFGSGLLGLVAIARRRQSGVMRGSPVAA